VEQVQGVTAIDIVDGYTIDTCNREDIRARRMIAREAQRTAKICGKCGRSIAPSEPVYRGAVSVGGWGQRVNAAAVCSDCLGSKSKREGFFNTHCEHCGRGLRLAPRLGRYHAFCCNRCGWRYQSARQRRKRAQKRAALRCVACGDPLTAGRSDAKYCGGTCRQRAYRERAGQGARG